MHRIVLHKRRLGLLTIFLATSHNQSVSQSIPQKSEASTTTKSTEVAPPSSWLDGSSLRPPFWQSLVSRRVLLLQRMVGLFPPN